MNELLLLLLLRPLLRPSPLTPPRLLVLSTHSVHLNFVWSNNYVFVLFALWMSIGKIPRYSTIDHWIQKSIKQIFNSELFWAVRAAEKKKIQNTISMLLLRCKKVCLKMYFTASLKKIITHNFLKNIRGLVKINWWFDVMNKILKVTKSQKQFKSS